MPGVLLTLTAEDWKRAGHGELTVVHPMPFSDGRPMNDAPRPAFAGGKVRHVGDIVAAVVAENRFAAEEAAEAVAVDYEPLPCRLRLRAAVAPRAPLVHERFGTNVVFEIERGNREATEAAMAAAAKVVELQLRNSRLAANPLEPRAYLCDYDAAADRYTLYATTQQPHYLRRWLSVYTLHIPEHKIRVISPDVGGGFGVKGNFAVEVSTIVWAAQMLRRPVKWTATRSETFLSDAQARDHDSHARMGFDDDGRIVAMQVDTLAALGGYLSNFAPSIPGNSYPQTITGLYRTPNLHLRVRGVYTNTVPVDAYRGSGRPEATWINERLIERGAHELGIDAVEIRRRNLIGATDFPYPAPGGRVYDSGDPPALLEKLLSLGKLSGAAPRAGRIAAAGRSRWASGLPVSSTKRAPGRAPISPSAAACTAAGRARSCASTATARSRCSPAAIPTARATTSPSRRSPRTGSALTSTISAWSRATPTGFLSATAPGARAPRRSPAPPILRASDKIVAKARRFAAEALECASRRCRL